MGLNTADQRPVAAEGESNVFSVSFNDVLDTGEKLTGTPIVVEQTTSDLTITNKVISTAVLAINGRTVGIGRAVQFKVRGQLVANTPYTLKITVGTDASPSQTKVKFIVFKVEGS